MTGRAILVAIALAGGVSLGAAAAPEWLPPEWLPKEGREWLGTPAPEWQGIRWLQGGPLSLSDLQGKVILLRFWLADCPFCERSAPALETLWRKYRDRGLVVVGLHHPKSEATRDPETVRSAARNLGFTFPIGTDNDWATIRAYGVGTRFIKFTSVSFLIDASGVIRFVHDGGEFHAGGGPAHRECQAAYRELEKTLRGLLPDPE